MVAVSTPNYERILSLEDDFVTFRDSPFTDLNDTGKLPAVALDWSPKEAVFNVTLLSISHEGGEERLWSDRFSISKIQRRHFELCLVFPELKDLFPQLPKDPQGLWGYIQWTYVPPDICMKLEEYFKNAFSICGWKLFSSVFFGEPVLFDEDYTISSLELKRNQFVKDIEQLLQAFQKHLVEKCKENDADLLFGWYEVLWDCLEKVTDAEKNLLNFDCEPYEEMRDISQKERTECASMFNQQSMTSSTFQSNVQNFSEWEDQYVDTVKKINQFRIMHFERSLPRLQQTLKLLQDDADKFADDDDRRTMVEAKLYQFEKEALQNEIEILNCSNELKLLERDNVRREVIALDEDLSMPEKLNEKEIVVYTKQCEILVVCCEIQDKNERIVRLDLQKLASEVGNEALAKLKETLSKSLRIIARKKAILRNKKKTCEAEIKKLTRKIDEKQEQYETHHAVQMKIQKRREDDEQKKDARLEERQKTLLRLKEYKNKYPKTEVVKPPRYQPPSELKQGQKVKSNTSAKTTKEKSQNQSNQKRIGSFKSVKTPATTLSTLELSTTSQPHQERSSEYSQIPVQPESRNVIPPPPPPPCTAGAPPPPPPPPLPGIVSTPPGIRPLSLPVAINRSQFSASDKSPPGQPSSLTQQTLDLDSLKVARSRLKKKDAAIPAVNSDQKGLPSGNELTRAIQSVKLRKVVNQDKPAELSPDGAEFLKKALERMNKFTNLSFEEDEDAEEQEW